MSVMGLGLLRDGEGIREKGGVQVKQLLMSSFISDPRCWYFCIHSDPAIYQKRWYDTILKNKCYKAMYATLSESR